MLRLLLVGSRGCAATRLYGSTVLIVYVRGCSCTYSKPMGVERAEAGQSEDAFVSPREYFSGDENNYLDQVYAAGSAVGTPMAPHPPLSPRGGPSPAKKRPQIRRLGAMGQSEREDGGGSKVCDVMLAAAAVHVADAIAYRDFSDYGDYGGHSRQEPSDFARTESASSRSSSNQFEDVHGVSGTLRAFCCKNFWLPLVGAGAGRRKCAMRRVRAHKLYYANAGIKVVRTTSMLCLQLLVLTEAPPWCVSLSKDAGGGTCNVATLPEYEMSGFPILAPVTTHMVEGVCLFVQALDLTVRRFVHGEALWSQAFEAWAVRCTTSILATLIDARACMLESVSRVGSIAAATDLGANVGVPQAGMMFLNCLLWGVSCVLLSVRATPPTSTQTTTWILSAWYLRVVARMPIYILRARRLRRDLAGVRACARATPVRLCACLVLSALGQTLTGALESCQAWCLQQGRLVRCLFPWALFSWGFHGLPSLCSARITSEGVVESTLTFRASPAHCSHSLCC